jgi:hypothetical protein
MQACTPALVYGEGASKADGGREDDERASCKTLFEAAAANDVAAAPTLASEEPSSSMVDHGTVRHVACAA